MTDLPAPLTPADCDLRDFDFMPLDFRRLFGSDWWIAACIEAPAAAAAAVNLWGAAWQQVPAGSLPKTDTLLLRYSMLDGATWRKVRVRVLLPWVECADAVARRMRRNKRTRGTARPPGPYRCRICHMWHIGGNPR